METGRGAFFFLGLENGDWGDSTAADVTCEGTASSASVGVKA